MYSSEMVEVVIDRLSRQSLRRICADEGMPDRRTVERWMQEDPEFAARCAHARSIHADHEFDGLEDIEEQVLSGDIDANAARVVLSSRQWRLSKIASKKYGDKVENVMSGEVGIRTIERRIIDAAP